VFSAAENYNIHALMEYVTYLSSNWKCFEEFCTCSNVHVSLINVSWL